MPDDPPALPSLPPSILRRSQTDEYAAPAYTDADRRVLRATHAAGSAAAERLGVGNAPYWGSRFGTAAGLRALDAEYGDFYAVPPEAVVDREAAASVFEGPETVLDVQTHYIADRAPTFVTEFLLDMYRQLMPSWWTELEGDRAYDFAEYLRCVFLGSETAVAVLTSGPGLDEGRYLFNDEMAATRVLFDRLGETGRVLNHAVVHPNVTAELASMERWRDDYSPSGWKVYTLGHSQGGAKVPGSMWMLDDEDTGIPFLERVRELGPKLVCAHKGLSGLVAAGSPSDIGPAAAAFPDITFLVYHSGYEISTDPSTFEGPYTPETAQVGVNRLVTTLRDNGIAPGGNVYAELGSTWFCMIRHPQEAAHVLGKLLLAVGDDNVLWGTDGIWYGPTQPTIDAFRAFEIPVEYQERYGYPALTAERKAKILGLNAARVYGIDIAAARERAATDDLAWARAALDEFRARGDPSL